ncbi:hypothetical protein ACQP3J_29680, partial [Escherichia coli]
SAILKAHLQTKADRNPNFIDPPLYKPVSMLIFLLTSLRIKSPQNGMGTKPFQCVEGCPSL